MSSIKISVIICSYNRANYIINALDSLKNQTIPYDTFEVIVVDNNSTDNTEEKCIHYLKELNQPNFIYTTELNQGSSFARNKGAALAKAPLLVFMDDDAVAEPDFLEKILLFFKEVPTASGMGGRIIPKYIPEEPDWMSHFVSSLVGNFNYSNLRTAFKGGKYPLESNMVVTRTAFERVGGFNVLLPGVKGTLRIGGEGKDFFYKMVSEGMIIFYDPAVIVHHVVEVSKLTREYMYRVASGIGRGERVRIEKKGICGLTLKFLEYLYKLGGAIVLGMLYIIKGNHQKALPVIQFRIDAIKGLINY
jgi:glycosyltransferase involved in cell wall biosynthesis